MIGKARTFIMYGKKRIGIYNKSKIVLTLLMISFKLLANLHLK